MKKARIIIGANYGDEGKGTVVAKYTKEAIGNVLCVLTNGGAQRGHSILTEQGNITYQHFGSGTYYGADSYYSRYFILNPIQFVREYEELLIKPKKIYRDSSCRWSTPFDIIANHIQEEQLDRTASCCMGIWNTIKRYIQSDLRLEFDRFMELSLQSKIEYLDKIKFYYERQLGNIPDNWKKIWNSNNLILHFLEDCYTMNFLTFVGDLQYLYCSYNNIIFEGGQGLLLGDTGIDSFFHTPTQTGIEYAWQLLYQFSDTEISAHYVTRPYLTRHGDGPLEGETKRAYISQNIQEDRCNHYNPGQGEFRYGNLDIDNLLERIKQDNRNRIMNVHLEVTHCDEMDRITEFKKRFKNINTYDSPYV